jgi:hypothetical protein
MEVGKRKFYIKLEIIKAEKSNFGDYYWLGDDYDDDFIVASEVFEKCTIEIPSPEGGIDDYTDEELSKAVKLLKGLQTEGSND